MALKRRTKRAILGILGLSAVVGIVLTSTARYLDAQRERQRYEEQRKELLPPEPVAVEVTSERLVRERRFSAQLEPWVEAEVPSEVSGKVIETLVEAGMPVRKGDVLARLDARRARIAVDLAEARSQEALRLLGEAERLQKSNVVSRTAYEAALSEAKVAAAQLDDARDMLSRHTIVAPFDGVVERRMVDAGDAVNANQPVARVVDLSRLRVKLSATVSDLEAFQPGSVIKVWPSSGRNGPYEAVVRFVSPAADPATRLFAVEAELDNSKENLPGGLEGFVDAEVELFSEGPVVPAAAVRFTGRDAVVLKEMDGRAVATPVTVGPEIDGRYPVLEGLQCGERVFVR
ncbi:MAG: efflux RND transporter periplasmic adaptor subunit [Terrimicrobiaceae bacterium]